MFSVWSDVFFEYFVDVGYIGGNGADVGNVCTSSVVGEVESLYDCIFDVFD